jgi:hypothetical protein
MVTTRDGSGTLAQPIDHARSLPYMATTSLMSVGNAAESPEPILRPSPATGYHADILDVYDPDLGYDTENFLYQPPPQKRRATSRATPFGGL